MKKLLMLLLVMLVASGLIIAGCGETTTTTTAQPTTTAAETPKYGGTLTVIYPYMGKSLGWPATSQGGYSLWQQVCLEPLVQQLMDGTFIPRLATDWTIGDDQSVTFTLRQGVKFHDGTDFNAEAVKFNLDAMAAEHRGGSVNWASVDVIDDYHIKITYANWANWAVADFAFAGNLYMVSPTAYENNGLDWTKDNMVGTGPFVQTDKEQDVHIKFDANKDYWQEGKPYLDKLVILCVEDSVTAQTAILSGDADILNTEADQKVIDLQAEGLEAVTRMVGVMNMFMDTANPDSPFAIQANREAVEYAIDKVTICQNLSGGMMTPAYWMAPPGVPAYKEVAGRKYDPEKAKEKLAEAGNPDGFTFTFYPIPVPLFENPAIAIQADLAKVGIIAEYQKITNTKFGELVVGDWENAAIFAAVSSCVPNWVQALSGFFGPNSILYKPMLRSDAFIEAYNAAAFTKEYDNEKVQALLQVMYDEQMVIPCFNSGEAWVFQPYVRGAWDPWPAGLQMWSPENAWLDK
jgi:peptide/nickel transport system substrate-binding protein